MLEDAVYAMISGNAAIGAALGARSDSGIYPLTIPEDPTLPAISYEVISTTDFPTFQDGLGVTKARLRLSCWGSTYSEAVTLRSTVSARLAGAASGPIQKALRLSMGDAFADVARQFVAKVDFFVWYTNSI